MDTSQTKEETDGLVGTDRLENLQLLYPSCNRIKGDGPMEYLVTQLTGIAQ